MYHDKADIIAKSASENTKNITCQFYFPRSEVGSLRKNCKREMEGEEEEEEEEEENDKMFTSSSRVKSTLTQLER